MEEAFGHIEAGRHGRSKPSQPCDRDPATECVWVLRLCSQHFLGPPPAKYAQNAEVQQCVHHVGSGAGFAQDLEVC